MSTPTSFEGSCHCGSIHVALAFTKPAADIQTRSCQCGFCTRHGAVTISDPDGRAVISISASDCATYQFGTRTATSLICRRCGTYCGAFLEDGGEVWSIANARGLAIAAFHERQGEPMVYEQETAAERTARRKRRWTPTEIRFKVYTSPDSRNDHAHSDSDACPIADHGRGQACQMAGQRGPEK